MVTEEYLGRSRLFRRLKSGPHRQIVELYAARLVKDELAGMATWRCLYLVDDLVSWIKRCGLRRCKMPDYAEWKQDDDGSTSSKSARTTVSSQNHSA